MNDLTNLSQNPAESLDVTVNSSASSNLESANWSYEATVDQIETIIGRIEAGELELTEVFDQFATAVDQLRQCETFLHQRQQQMDLLIEKLVDDPESY
uniref:exodeoxyribonuclease VII small subunit n=1 Tax=Trichocoleus desertorum TaxID=1481672 RepID=UPI0025B4E222|nr:exodeoxyribonuclease VII small subunit [Trichocoleus desertorum]